MSTVTSSELIATINDPRQALSPPNIDIYHKQHLSSSQNKQVNQMYSPVSNDMSSENIAPNMSNIVGGGTFNHHPLNSTDKNQPDEKSSDY